MPESLNNRARRAARWSVATEATTRLIAPVTQLILARILSPEAFGVVATVIMVTSFANVFSDAGFQKYVVQHDFSDRSALRECTNVAFWASLALSLGVVCIAGLYRDAVASFVGSPGYGLALLLALAALPVSILTGTQTALFQREFRYRALLPSRVGSAVLTLVLSVSLAALGADYWSLIVGIVGAELLSAIWLTAVSEWRPSASFDFHLLRRMLSFSVWSLLEALAIWATVWSGTFIVASRLSAHETGLYREPMSVVNGMFGLVTAATTPVLFAALSRLQSDRVQFRAFFLRFQALNAVVLLPLGVVAFMYRDILTGLLFGPQWTGAALMFGAWSLSSAFSIVFWHYCGEVFRALGRPRTALLAQLLYMAVLIPVLSFASHAGFTSLVVASAVVRIAGIIINQAFLYGLVGVSIVSSLRGLAGVAVAVASLGLVSWLVARWAGGHVIWALAGIVGSGLCYGAVCLVFRDSRLLVQSIIRGVAGDKVRH